MGVLRMSSGLRLTWILVISFILILENPVLAAPGSKRARPNLNWNDAIIRVNFAGSGYGNALEPGMHKRSELMSDNSNIQPTSSNQHPTTNNQQPTPNPQQPTPNHQPPTTN